ncbi:LysM peptidoglycan-binding domain-containing protein [Aciduricibacillus chroicocephali]|uniref:LysM peptidoglycan-binding domain-containing protein n=2 Tax=Aciduricibacillus chroicocephali TaxID=3054939 RepID=A0ABY9KZD7_9BACI|nr:LysM peptidoglycan-binding domain-containing protein [Bacillaceae bacterium 44XB]
MSVTATATIAASFIGAGSAEAAAYKVKKGDTLYSIAHKNKTSVSSLKSINKLKSSNIKVGQVLQTTAKKKAASSKTKVAKSAAVKTASTKVYTVKKGDTLYRIATNNKISVNTLKAWNGLKSNNIKVGQKLTVKGGKAVKSSSVKQTSNNVSSAGYDVDKLISVAKDQLGTPYVFGGSSPSGFDCSGFISYVYNKAGKSIGRTSAAGFYSKASSVSNPEVGDLVFFAGTYKSGISHVGIYIGGNQFIHAGGDRVQITSLSNSYWKSHFHSYKRFN